MLKANSPCTINVLMVDNDAKFLASAKKCLNSQGGLEVQTALSSEDALKKMGAKKPDVIVCGIQTPTKTGFEFLKAIRDNDESIPFIVFATPTKKILALEAIYSGANAMVKKYGKSSVVYQQLKSCIESVTQNSMSENVFDI